ncbi:MAG: GIY-YIG nuclease family protein [Bacteroidota bacterium]
MPAWFYILRLRSNALYSGATHNLTKRTREHFQGRGCRTTKLDPPIAMVHFEEYPSYKEALHRERQVKQWTRAKKEALIRGDKGTLRDLARRRH